MLSSTPCWRNSSVLVLHSELFLWSFVCSTKHIFYSNFIQFSHLFRTSSYIVGKQDSNLCEFLVFPTGLGHRRICVPCAWQWMYSSKYCTLFWGKLSLLTSTISRQIELRIWKRSLTYLLKSCIFRFPRSKYWTCGIIARPSFCLRLWPGSCTSMLTDGWLTSCDENWIPHEKMR